MKNSLQRIAAMLLALIMLFAIGCKKVAPDDTVTSPFTVDLADETPQPESPGAAPQATAVPDADASAAFAQLDLTVFRWYACASGDTYHQYVADPANFGIDRSMVDMTLGEFTEEDSKIYSKEAEAYLEQLLEIPRSALSADEQLSYDVLAEYLERVAADVEHEYFYEPLTEYSGLHAQLPLLFALFVIQTEQDAEDYLTLLADVPRFLGQVLTYEQKRAEQNMFMSSDALKEVLAGCKSIIESRDDSFLYATFNSAVDALPDLAPERAQELKSRNEALIKNDFIDAYRALYNGLETLKGKCRDDQTLYDLGEAGRSYFELCLQNESDSELSAEDALEMLQNEMYYMLVRSAEILEANPKTFDAAQILTTGDTDSNLELLKTLTKSILPALPDHDVTVSDVPEELEDMMSPAAYVIPALDDWKDNRVLINPASESATPLLTLAHEIYPGHMYQYVYQRGMEKLGVMQRALHFGGYAEGWSQMGEYLFVQNQTRFDHDYCEVAFYNNMIANALLPSIVSIWVNYQGYSKAAVKTKLDALLLSGSDALVESYYQLAVEQPFYTFCYSIGYSQLMQLMRDAENDLGSAFNQKEFLTAYLDLGPGYFNILRERMDVWVDERILEALAEG